MKTSERDRLIRHAAPSVVKAVIDIASDMHTSHSEAALVVIRQCVWFAQSEYGHDHAALFTTMRRLIAEENRKDAESNGT